MTYGGYQQYQEMQARTASPVDLIVMLYEGALRFLTRSKIELESNNVVDAHNNLIRTQDIVLELRSSLNKEIGPLAEELDRLYEYMYRRLVAANMRKDTQAIDEVTTLLRQLLSAWREAAKASQRDLASQPEARRAAAFATSL